MELKAESTFTFFADPDLLGDENGVSTTYASLADVRLFIVFHLTR